MSKNERMTLKQANEIFMCISPSLSKAGVQIVAAGSFRRRAATVGDLDFVAVVDGAYHIQMIMDEMAILGYEADYKRPSCKGFLLKQQIFAFMSGGFCKNSHPQPKHMVEFHYCDEDSLGAHLIMWTGNVEFNKLCLRRASELGMRLTEDGLFGQNSQTRIAIDEDHILERLNLSEYRDPMKRSISMPTWVPVSDGRYGEQHCYVGLVDAGRVWLSSQGGWNSYSAFYGNLTADDSNTDPPFATVEKAQDAVERHARYLYDQLGKVYAKGGMYEQQR